MCGRFVTLSDELTWSQYCELMGLSTSDAMMPEPGVAFPGSEQPIVLGSDLGPELSLARWGWYRNKAKQTGSQYNTRGETLLQFYASLAEKQRAIVPFAGFLEGQKSKHGDSVFRSTLSTPGSAAAVWKELPDGKRAFSILTINASANVRPYHHRMPIVFEPSVAREWLGPNWQACLDSPTKTFSISAVAA